MCTRVGVAAAGLLAACLLVGRAAPPAEAAERAPPSAGPVLPALSSPASGRHLTGKIIWLDLVTPDLTAGQRFYGELLGWSFHDVPTRRRYAIGFDGAQPVAGLLERTMPVGAARQPAWLMFISVRDIDAAKRRALAHGARLLSDVHEFPGRGRQAVFTDPEGAVFAMLESADGDPGDALAVPGNWIWSALFCRDPDQEAAFYQAVFGYEVFDLSDAQEDAVEHLLLASGGYARAGINQFPIDHRRRHAHWLSFVRVADVAATAARAQALGGRVLVAPRIGRHGDLLAVVADPSGAPVGLMQWSAEEPGGFGRGRPERP